MKAVMVMFDSLNRHMLPPYGCDWVHAPNFERLAENSVTFTNCYVGSMPCMPARRELHTGRYNFLHRSWGPIEPFDDSMPEILKKNGIYTHLVSDHYHYWEDGGCTYHTRYSSWEISRGQEGDPWKGIVREIETPDHIGVYTKQDAVNRMYMDSEDKQPQAKTFSKGLQFIEENYNDDNWFLTIETFDPHEPFFTHKKYKDIYPHNYTGPQFDWPMCGRVVEGQDEVQHLKFEYAALMSMCDEYIGKVLDYFDEYNLWEDTLLIVNTDHGFLLGEHGYWAKSIMPFYNEIAHIPLFVWDPRYKIRNVKRHSLVQTIDIPATLLSFFNIPLPTDMQGRPLTNTIINDTPVRTGALFGIFGGHVNYTDGRYVYMRAPIREDNQPLYNYTLMPTHMREFFSFEELKDLELHEPFSFTKGLKTMKVESRGRDCFLNTAYNYGTLLFDTFNDPKQENPINDKVIEEDIKEKMIKLMIENDTPKEQFVRLGLTDKAGT